jgi:uncharacterized protein HemX
MQTTGPTNSPTSGSPDDPTRHPDTHAPTRSTTRGSTRGERGEGVISTAIAVLIVAFLGIALWTGFDSMMNSATERTRAQVEQIGG